MDVEKVASTLPAIPPPEWSSEEYLSLYNSFPMDFLMSLLWKVGVVAVVAVIVYGLFVMKKRHQEEQKPENRKPVK